ncbi:unnamed protein product, partial [Cuscuta europaea]
MGRLPYTKISLTRFQAPPLVLLNQWEKWELNYQLCLSDQKPVHGPLPRYGGGEANVCTAKASPMKFMPMILMDSVGNRVQATAFQVDIEWIDQHLALYSTYLVSNAYVNPITDMLFCVDGEYPYVWSFTR